MLMMVFHILTSECNHSLMSYLLIVVSMHSQDMFFSLFVVDELSDEEGKGRKVMGSFLLASN